jgi:hypothetical protein
MFSISQYDSSLLFVCPHADQTSFSIANESHAQMLGAKGPKETEPTAQAAVAAGPSGGRGEGRGRGSKRGGSSKGRGSGWRGAKAGKTSVDVAASSSGVSRWLGLLSASVLTLIRSLTAPYVSWGVQRLCSMPLPCICICMHSRVLVPHAVSIVCMLPESATQAVLTWLMSFAAHDVSWDIHPLCCAIPAPCTSGGIVYRFHYACNLTI